MNLSEYHLIVTLIKRVKEPSIAIMIAEDALDLGKRVFAIENNISQREKKISCIQNHINNMTEEFALIYFHPDWEGEVDEEAIKEAKLIAESKIDRYKQEMEHFMEDYESIMGQSYNIDYIVDKLVNNAINESIKTLEYNKLKEMFNSNEEQEKSVIVKTIKGLLNECEIAKTKFKKFEITTCMMCVISNSPIFLSNYERFKDTVLSKLNELSSQINDIRIDKTEYYNYIEKIRSYEYQILFGTDCKKKKIDFIDSYIG